MIKTENLTKIFRTEEVETVALNGVSINVEDGEFVAIMGPSGCGKSTLLNILGLLDNPNSGEYWLDGEPVGKLKESERTKYRRGRIGFVFQSFNLIPKLTAEENVELPLIYQGIKKDERTERVAAALERVKLGKRANHFPTELSGGQQQRVAIARAIVTRPSLILADEPTGNLDSKTTVEIMDIFHELHSQGNTIVLITHDDSVAAQAGRRVRILDGHLTEEGA